MSSEWSPPNSQSGAPTADLTQLMPLVEESWRRLKTNPGPVAIGLVTGMGVSSIGMMFIYIAIFGVMFVGVLAGAALSAALGMSEDAAAGISSLFMVLAMLVIYPLLFGFIMAAQVIMMRGGLVTARGGTADLGAMFSGLPRITLKVLGMTFVMMCAILPSALLLYIPAIYLGMRWSLAMYYVIDTNLGIFDCMRLSWRKTEGKVLDLFIKHFVFGLGALFIGVVTCYLGFIFVLPLQMVFMSLVYMQLSERHEAGLPDPDVYA
jgi:uncharacterized membrane protein